jgi:HK97 gp10 family phage protein
MAGFTITGTVDGLQPIINRMRGFKDGVKNRALKRGLTKVGRLVKKSAKALAPVDTTTQGLTVKGLYKKSMDFQVSVIRGTVVVKIGPKSNKQQVGTRKRGGKKSKPGDPIFQNPAKIGHLVEFGHGGPHPAPAKPHMRPAWDATRGLVLPIIAAEVDVEIGKQAVKSV